MVRSLEVSLQKKAETFISHLSRQYQYYFTLMASISAFGYLPQSTALTGTSSTTVWRRTISLFLLYSSCIYWNLSFWFSEMPDDCGCSISRPIRWLLSSSLFEFASAVLVFLFCRYRLSSELKYNLFWTTGGNCGCVHNSGEFDRRKLLTSSVGVLIGAFAYDTKDGDFAAASQFADSKIFNSLFEGRESFLVLHLD